MGNDKKSNEFLWHELMLTSYTGDNTKWHRANEEEEEEESYAIYKSLATDFFCYNYSLAPYSRATFCSLTVAVVFIFSANLKSIFVFEHFVMVWSVPLKIHNAVFIMLSKLIAVAESQAIFIIWIQVLIRKATEKKKENWSKKIKWVHSMSSYHNHERSQQNDFLPK